MLEKEYPAAQLAAMSKPYHPDFQKWAEALNDHLAGTHPHLDLPLDIRATAFQIRVWNYLQSIPTVKFSPTPRWRLESSSQRREGRRASLRREPGSARDPLSWSYSRNWRTG